MFQFQVQMFLDEVNCLWDKKYEGIKDKDHPAFTYPKRFDVA